MTDEQDQFPRELELLKAFKDGVIMFHFGYYIDDEAVVDRGFDQMSGAAKALRELRPDGIRALEPLMDDPEPGVQVMAADYLMRVFPERALPLLEKWANSAELEAGTSARAALRDYKAGRS